MGPQPVISVACPEVLPNTEKRDASVDNFVPQHFFITSNEETEAGELWEESFPL